ncbi:MAG: glucose-6-phosphate isomerase [Defluviitaleaceae bacterium]|nr:glucose-6-phosphate isomerase [Defluviitaleaceae bacterium]
MKIKLDYTNMVLDIKNIREKIESAKVSISEKKSKGLMDFMLLPHNQGNVVEEILDYKEKMKGKIENIVILGIGGSAFGTYVLHNALNHPYHNEFKTPKLYIADNIDPERLFHILERVDINKTLFNVITKSGETIETISQFMIIKNLLGGKAKELIVITTDEESGSLIKVAKNEGFKTFFVPKGVGGRFSVLTPVGLLPAAFLGLDIKEILRGASQACEDTAITFAAMQYMSLLDNKNIFVMMPYVDRLKLVPDWYSQLFSESLSKEIDNDGNIVNTGFNVAKALGATDQHSQLQLYIEGPKDKIIIFLDVDEYHEEMIIPKNYENIDSLKILGGVPHSKLIKLSKKATEASLTEVGQMNMTLTLPKITEFTIGQLLYMLEYSCAFLGELMNINAFNQPGVEHGKKLIYKYLSKI